MRERWRSIAVASLATVLDPTIGTDGRELTSHTRTAHSEHSFRMPGHCGRLSPTGRGYWQKYAPQPSHCTGWRGLHGSGRGCVFETGIWGRGDFCATVQDSARRPRTPETPETLKERGRAELTGTKGRDASAKGSFVAIELNEVVADISMDVGVEEATRTCDWDMGVSEDSDSLSAVEKMSCWEAVGVRSGSGVEALCGLNSGMTRRCGGSLCVRTWSRSVCMSL
jgi:hypothetical protein